MGVKHFFIYVKNNFASRITNIRANESYKDIGKTIDVLLIDMNGLFHTSAQKVYEYGNNKKPKSLLRRQPPVVKNSAFKELQFFQDVCLSIECLLEVVEPRKKLVMCVDGPAPFSKSQQQRSRRFRSVHENVDSEFDTSNLSVGTVFMDKLCRYIDWYIKKQITENEKWQKLEVVFSNDKHAGEGEQSLLSYIRKYGSDEETYCINGLDADIIMLALVSHKPNFHIIREDMYNSNPNVKDSVKYLNVDVGGIRMELVEKLKFSNEVYNACSAINDFVLMLYLVGNDFLPHVPSIEILEDGIDIMIDIYRAIGEKNGHLTFCDVNKKIKFRHETLELFFQQISKYEKSMLEHKMNKKHSFFPDSLLDKHCKFVDSSHVLDIEAYKNEYMKSKFPETISEQELCHDYLEGIQWVLSYYTSGIPDWNWHFKYHYAPFASHIAKHVKSFVFKKYTFSQPLTPFQQLLCILPPKSGYLLPEPLCQLLTNKDSPLQKYCPDKITIDLSGKRKEWEGIVLCPIVDRNEIKKYYFTFIDKVDKRDLHRNILEPCYLYKYNPTKSEIFKSSYGNKKINVDKVSIEF
jgi:5'-3' exonuclease